MHFSLEQQVAWVTAARSGSTLFIEGGLRLFPEYRGNG
ncbi:hypothetical protein J2Y83_001779 [Pseudomonas marginalis]|nr:hypothetical protein [Pseudomonas marginalis]MCP1523310.1 hypothetical protein [Pseudomonas marginalis]MDQ0501675.1 hypothetical protein [Pseudomonas marginalis]